MYTKKRLFQSLFIITLISSLLIFTNNLFCAETYNRDKNKLIEKIKELEIQIEELKREQVRLSNINRPDKFLKTFGDSFGVRTFSGLSNNYYQFGISLIFYITKSMDILIGHTFFRFETEKRWVFGEFIGFIFKKTLARNKIRTYGGPLFGLLLPEGRFIDKKPLEFFGGMGGIEIFIDKYNSFFLEIIGGSSGTFQGSSEREIKKNQHIDIVRGVAIQLGAKFYF